MPCLLRVDSCIYISQDEAELFEQSLLPLDELSPSDDSTSVQTRTQLSDGSVRGAAIRT